MRVVTPAEVWKEWENGDHAEAKREVLPSFFEEGTNPRCLLITGENGSGKSLAVEILRQVSHDILQAEGGKLEVMDVGMKRRVAAGIERSFIFGHETTESTGNVSIRVALRGVANSREREHPHWLILDEPDIGVGDGYHTAIGEYLADFANTLHPACMGFAVVTHSRAIAKELIAAGASSLRVGQDLRPIGEWLANGDRPKSVADLLALQETVRDKRSSVNRLFDTLRADKRQNESSRGMKV
jgi:Fe-S cluster assembly ATPase SufC